MGLAVAGCCRPAVAKSEMSDQLCDGDNISMWPQQPDTIAQRLGWCGSDRADQLTSGVHGMTVLVWSVLPLNRL